MRKKLPNWGKLITFLSALAMIYSCTKEFDDNISPSKEIQQVDVNTIKKAFYDKGYEPNLDEKFNDSYSIHWEPAWNEATQQIPHDSVSYVYVPLYPKPKAANKYLSKTFTLVGIKEFIVIKKSKAGFTFNLARYNFEDAEDKYKNQVNNTFLFRSFTGSLLIKDLSDSTLRLIKYKNGVKEDAVSSSKGLRTSATNGWECVAISDCGWTAGGTASCSSVIGTRTNGVGYCPEPGGAPSCGEYWTMTDSYNYLSCQFVPDPPLPGGGGGGSDGGTGTGSLPCPGDVVVNPTIAPSGGWNIKGGRFGMTRTELDGSPKAHYGIDITVAPNTPLGAMYAGKVVAIENKFQPGPAGHKKKSYGNYVTIRSTLPNGETIDIKYNHLNRVDVALNSTISQGAQIGLSGKTGNAWKVSIAHVHVQVLKNGVNINPEPYVATKFDAAGKPINDPC